MEENDERTMVVRDLNQAVSNQEPALPGRVTPDEIYKEIDKVKSQIREAPPGLIHRMIDPHARRRADVIEEARIQAIESRTALIKGMRQVIDTYIQTHVEDIKVRQKAYLLPRVTELINELSQTIESSIVEMLKVAQRSVDQITAIPGLSKELQERQIEAAYKRAESKQDTLVGEQLRMIEEVTNHLRELMGT